ncbi:MAG: heme exporter protein CcmB [candidate division Zixibacteria bacterium]
MPKNSTSLIAKSVAILRKDIRCEFRTRYALNAILLFGITTLTVVSFSVGQMNLEPAVYASLFWIIIFFAAMSGLAQVFIREEEAKTSTILKLTADSTAVYLGKLVFNFFLLIILEVIITPMFIIMTDVNVQNFQLFLVILFLGGIALVGTTTLIAALIAKAGVKGALFAVLSFPILLPLLIGAIEGTKKALSPGAGFAAASPEIQLLFAYSVVMITASLMLFEFVWND